MKAVAISVHERALIITHLAERGTWRGIRLGAHVIMSRFKVADGSSQIHYSVRIGERTISDRARTVFDSVAEVNSLIARHGQPAKEAIPEPAPFTRRALQMREGEWLPYPKEN